MDNEPNQQAAPPAAQLQSADKLQPEAVARTLSELLSRHRNKILVYLILDAPDRGVTVDFANGLMLAESYLAANSPQGLTVQNLKVDLARLVNDVALAEGLMKKTLNASFN